MTARPRIGVLFLHALPLDGRMWSPHLNVLPGSTYAPTLYGCGDSMHDWARAALRPVTEERIVVVGNSVGGSCALEVASIAPERVAALVLIGTNARHRPDPGLQARALSLLERDGVEAAWSIFWHPLFADGNGAVRSQALQFALSHSPQDIARGVSVFHTRPDRKAMLAALDIPVVFVTGAEDTAPGPQSSARQTGLTRHGRLHVIEQCGHYVPMERPDALRAILRDVIAQVETG